MKKINGYIKKIGICLAVGGIIWNAAVLHNDVSHLRETLDELKEQVKAIQTYLLEHK